MASPGPSSPRDSRSARRRFPAASNAGVLPPDVLIDVLLRLPAKELCRLRTICRYWRSLTSDPLFVSEHAVRHPNPLFLANFRDDQTHICVVDLSGNVVKRIPNAHGHLLLPTSLPLACATTVRNSCRVLDPATGNVHVLPESPEAEHLNRENVRRPYTSYAFGRIATTGEYKVIRIFNRPTFFDFNEPHLFEVLTINNSGFSSGPSHSQWRAIWNHDDSIEPSSAVVVGEVVYFKVDALYDAMVSGDVNPGIPPDCILSFDLERKEWRGTLHGPVRDFFQTDEYDDDLDDYRSLWTQLTLADLRGSLGLVYYRKYRHIMDIWVLKDIDSGFWVKEYIIQIDPILRTTELCVNSLFMLDEGRLVIHFRKSGLMFIYDPRTNTSAQVEMGHLDAVAMYTGNLLSLQVSDMV